MDIVTSEQRSKNMAVIRSKDTKPEIYFRKLLFVRGYRYSLNSKAVPGHPDIYMRKYNTAIFVHGCFWHRHNGCKYAYMPKSRIEFWTKKFGANQKRDLVVQEELRAKGVKCLVVWECTIKKIQKDRDMEEMRIRKVAKFFESEEEILVI